MLFCQSDGRNLKKSKKKSKKKKKKLLQNNSLYHKYIVKGRNKLPFDM